MSIEGSASAKKVLRGRITTFHSVDKTLTVSGACADAKATGEAINYNVARLEDLIAHYCPEGVEIVSQEELESLIASGEYDPKKYYFITDDATIPQMLKDIDTNKTDIASAKEDIAVTLKHTAQYLTNEQKAQVIANLGLDAYILAKIQELDPPTTPAEYTLTVNYVDANGDTIANTETSTIVEGDEYSVSAKDIDGYTYNRAEGDALSGTADGDKEITFVYDVIVVEPDEPTTVYTWEKYSVTKELEDEVNQDSENTELPEKYLDNNGDYYERSRPVTSAVYYYWDAWYYDENAEDFKGDEWPWTVSSEDSSAYPVSGDIYIANNHLWVEYRRFLDLSHYHVTVYTNYHYVYSIAKDSLIDEVTSTDTNAWPTDGYDVESGYWYVLVAE